MVSTLQLKPITVEIWRQLPEDFCREVELVNGQVMRCGKPTREHQVAARRLVSMLGTAAEAHMRADPAKRLETGGDFDVLLREVPATVASPDAGLFDYAPRDERPLHGHRDKVIVEDRRGRLPG